MAPTQLPILSWLALKSMSVVQRGDTLCITGLPFIREEIFRSLFLRAPDSLPEILQYECFPLEPCLLLLLGHSVILSTLGACAGERPWCLNFESFTVSPPLLAYVYAGCRGSLWRLVGKMLLAVFTSSGTTELLLSCSWRQKLGPRQKLQQGAFGQRSKNSNNQNCSSWN